MAKGFSVIQMGKKMNGLMDVGEFKWHCILNTLKNSNNKETLFKNNTEGTPGWLI